MRPDEPSFEKLFAYFSKSLSKSHDYLLFLSSSHVLTSSG